MPFIRKDGSVLVDGEVSFGHQHIGDHIELDEVKDGIKEFRSVVDDRVNGGENMKKLYQAVILNKDLGKVEGTQWVTAEDKEQAFAKVNLTEHSVESVKVFLNKVGEYK